MSRPRPFVIACVFFLTCLISSRAADSAAPGRIDTIAGTGRPGYSPDGGQAVEAQLNEPAHCALDRSGHLYVVEAGNHCVRRIDLKTGEITSVAGNGQRGYSGDGGPARRATLNEPYAVAVGADGSLYLADRLNAVVRKVDGRSGIITTVAGNGHKGYSGDGGKATEAMLHEPHDGCLDGQGGLLIADVGDGRIRRVDLKSGIITTFAGTGKPKGKLDRSRIGDGGPATRAVIVGARAVCVDGKGNTYICEREGHAVRRVDREGIITTVAGTGQKGYSGDGGPALRATFNGPKALCCDGQGNVHVVDAENHAIRRIDVKTGIVTTVAGGHQGSDGDGDAATKAGLNRPHGGVVAADGTLYLADTMNHRVRRVTP